MSTPPAVPAVASVGLASPGRSAGGGPGPGVGLGPGALLAAAIGVLVAQLGMVTLAQGVGLGGWAFVLALPLAWLLAAGNAAAWTELVLMQQALTSAATGAGEAPRSGVPDAAAAGGLAGCIGLALGPLAAQLLVFAGYVTPALFGLPVELALVDPLLLAWLPTGWPAGSGAVLLITLMLALNLAGTDVFARVQTALALAVVAALALTGLLALLLPAGAAVGAGWGWPGAAVTAAAAAPRWAALGPLEPGAVLLAAWPLVALASWACAGLEYVAPMAAEARRPARDLPRAMFGGLAVIAVVQALFALGAACRLPAELLRSAPLPHLVLMESVWGPAARPLLGLLLLLASASLLNAVLAAVSRMLADLATAGLAFGWLGWRPGRRRTPVAALLFVAALPLAGLWWAGGDPSAILVLTVAASVAWLLAYALAQTAVLVLRRRAPQLVRPWRMPGAPITPLLTLAGIAAVVVHAAPEPALAAPIARAVAGVLAMWTLVGMAWLAWRRPQRR
ncbi:MAG: hypothetical protein RIQ53_2605 [Pseudomonadota bacterium]